MNFASALSRRIAAKPDLYIPLRAPRFRRVMTCRTSWTMRCGVNWHCIGLDHPEAFCSVVASAGEHLHSVVGNVHLHADPLNLTS
jgi:hypothetical protein